MAAEILVCPACRHATRKHGPDGCDVDCWCDMTPARINGTEAVPEPTPAAAEATSIEVEVTDEDREAARAELAVSQRATQEMREEDESGDRCCCAGCIGMGPCDSAEPADDGGDDEDDPDDEDVDELDGIGSEYIADPVERITEFAKIAPEYVRPVEPEPPAQPPRSPFADALMWWDAWHCTFCFSRYFAERVCCDRPAVPVQVLVLPREVSGG